MRCIFCLQERDPSDEHVFPDAIGGTLVIRRVCKPCNDCLGAQVDVHLTDHFAVLAKRHELKIPNRRGKGITWHRMFGHGVMANDPKQRVKIIEDRATGALRPIVLHKQERRIAEDGTAQIEVVLDASNISKLPAIIRKIREEGRPASPA